MKLGPRSSLGVQVLVFVLALCIILAIPGAMWKKTPDKEKKHVNSGHNVIKSSMGDLTSSIALYAGLLDDGEGDNDNNMPPTPGSSPTPGPEVSPIPTPTAPSPAASAGPQQSNLARHDSVNMPPIIQMNLSWKRAYRLEPVMFDSGSSYDPDGRITAYEWDFGDGGSGEGKSVEHTYEKEGNYTVRLRVVDDSGADRSAYVTAVIDDKPPVSVPGNDTNATVGEAIWFNGAGSYDPDGRIVGYNWSFGDGAIEQGEAVMHIYDMPGVYNVTLKVTDDSGSNATASMTVNVTQEKAAPMANLGNSQDIILLASAGITCLALVIVMRKRTK